MRHRKIVLKSETVRVLVSSQLARAQGGNTQGAACDNSVAKTQCDLAGCNFACTESCDACPSIYSECNTCTTP